MYFSHNRKHCPKFSPEKVKCTLFLIVNASVFHFSFFVIYCYFLVLLKIYNVVKKIKRRSRSPSRGSKQKGRSNVSRTSRRLFAKLATERRRGWQPGGARARSLSPRRFPGRYDPELLAVISPDMLSAASVLSNTPRGLSVFDSPNNNPYAGIRTVKVPRVDAQGRIIPGKFIKYRLEDFLIRRHGRNPNDPRLPNFFKKGRTEIIVKWQ